MLAVETLGKNDPNSVGSLLCILVFPNSRCPVSRAPRLRIVVFGGTKGGRLLWNTICRQGVHVWCVAVGRGCKIPRDDMAPKRKDKSISVFTIFCFNVVGVVKD